MFGDVKKIEQENKILDNKFASFIKNTNDKVKMNVSNKAVN
jgi:hypothetical protein